MNELLYHLVSRGFQDMIWGGELRGEEFLPQHGPAVLVSNHLGALGPIAVGASIPLQMYFWIQADMLDRHLAADYLRRDFIESQLHVSPPISEWLAKAIAKIHVPLLRAVGGIPVYSNSDGFQETFRMSVDLLSQGNFLLIFPEDPGLPMDPLFKMSPIKKGFTRLGDLYYERTRQCLPFYPIAVHVASRTVQVGMPIRYNPLNAVAVERQRIRNLLEHSIHAMYVQASNDRILRLPLTN